MFQPAFGELNIKAYQPHRPGGVVATSLFSHEELHADLVVLPPHSEISPHTHENENELFDVIEGDGIFVVNGVEFPGGAGKCVFVKAGTVHALRNDGDCLWTVRVTRQSRVYPRHVGMLVRRAVRKRLGLIS